MLILSDRFQWRMQDFRKGGSRVPSRVAVNHTHFSLVTPMRARRSNWLMTRSCVNYMYYYARVIGAVNASADRLSVTYTMQERQLRARLRRNFRNYVIPCQKGGSIAPLDPPLDPPLGFRVGCCYMCVVAAS